jgi:uncharacterized protein
LNRARDLTDASAIVITLLILGLVLILGEMARALVMEEMITPRQPRRPIVVEWHVVAIAAFFLLVFVLPAVVQLATGQRPPEKDSDASIVWAIATNFVIVGVVIPFLAVTGRNRLADYGIDARGWRAEVRFGGMGFLVAMPLVIAILVAMSSIRGPQTEHPYLKLVETGNETVLIGVAVAAVIAAPLTEELIFRVIFQGLLESRLRPAAAILLPALAFAAIHGIYDALPLFPLAVVLGIVYHLRRSYIAVVTIHAMFNATFLLLALGFRMLG